MVENKLGAGGTIAANYVAKATPDGYTHLHPPQRHGDGARRCYRKLPYNPLTDFEYIGQVADVPMTLARAQGLPGQQPARGSIALRHARTRTRSTSRNAGLGAVSHLCGMLLQQALGRGAARPCRSRARRRR